MRKTINNILTVIGGLTVTIFVLFGILQLVSPFPFEWEYEELPRVESPNGQFEIVPFRGNAGAVSGFTYDIFVVSKGKEVNRETDKILRVFTAYEDTRLLDYRWQIETVEIEVEDGPIGYYKTFYGVPEGYTIKKVGDVVLKIRKS